MAREVFMRKSRSNLPFIGLLGQHSTFISAYNAAQVCLTWYVFAFTGSAVAVGLVAIVETLAVLLISLPIGTMVDRLNKGMLLAVAGIASFLVFAFLSLNALFFSFDLVLVIILAAIWGASREVTRSAGLSAMPEVVVNGSIAKSNGIYRALGSSLGAISNAAAGGLIVAFGVIAGFLFSAGFYLASAVFAGFMLIPFLKRKRISGTIDEENRASMLDDLKEGFRWLAARKGFFLLTISATFFNFFMDMVITYYVIYVVAGIKASSLIYGLILSSLAAGDVSGSLIGGRLNLLKYSGKINVVLFGGVSGLSILMMGLLPGVYSAILFTFVVGLCFGISVNVWLTSAHNIVPPNMRGRYFAIDGVLSSISPVAIAAGAATIALIGIMGEFIIAGALMILFTFVFAMMKSLWTLDGSPRNINAHDEVL